MACYLGFEIIKRKQKEKRNLTLSLVGLCDLVPDYAARVVHTRGRIELHRLGHIAVDDADTKREGRHRGGALENL